MQPCSLPHHDLSLIPPRRTPKVGFWIYRHAWVTMTTSADIPSLETPKPRIKYVANCVTNEVDSQNNQEDCQTWKDA